MPADLNQPPAKPVIGDPGTRDVAAVPVEDWAGLARLLWTQRGLLEDLLFKLSTEQLIISSASTRWLNRADAEVQAAVRAVQDGELLRAVEVDALLRRLGLDPATSLRKLIGLAPEPWNRLLSDHQDALLRLTAEIDAVARDTASTGTALQAQPAPVEPGSTGPAGEAALCFESALQTTASTRQVSLLDFLE